MSRLWLAILLTGAAAGCTSLLGDFQVSSDTIVGTDSSTVDAGSDINTTPDVVNNVDSGGDGGGDGGVTHPVRVIKEGTGDGTVTSTPGGINCGPTCTAPFKAGELVTLKAVALPGSAFAGWSNGGCTGIGDCIVRPNAAVSVNAKFDRVHATWDTSWSIAGAVRYADNDRSAQNTSGTTANVRTNIGKRTGKWYWEIKATAGDPASNSGGLGFLESAMPNNAAYIGYVASGLSFGYGPSNTEYYFNWAGVTRNGVPPAGSAVTSGTTYMFALDMDGGRLWIGHNGAWHNGGNPATGAAPVATGVTGTVYPGITFYNNVNAFTANFGNAAFTYPVPAGFNAGLY